LLVFSFRVCYYPSFRTKVVFFLLLGSPPVTPINPVVLKKTEERFRFPEVCQANCEKSQFCSLWIFEIWKVCFFARFFYSFMAFPLLACYYPSFRTSFVLLRFFSFFFRRAYRRFSAEQRFLKNSPQSSLIWSKPLYSSFRNNLGSPIFQYLLGRS
jgi:hypothetical protein